MSKEIDLAKVYGCINKIELVGEQEQYKSEIERQCIEMQATIDLLKATTETLRKRLDDDAERYRWLRDQSANQYEHPLVVSQTRTEHGMRFIGPLTGRSLDAAVDAARSKK